MGSIPSVRSKIEQHLLHIGWQPHSPIGNHLACVLPFLAPGSCTDPQNQILQCFLAGIGTLALVLQEDGQCRVSKAI